MLEVNCLLKEIQELNKEKEKLKAEVKRLQFLDKEVAKLRDAFIPYQLDELFE